MKTAKIQFLPAILLGFSFAGETGAQNLNIPWYSVDGGAGRSTGGVYSVQGTIGQPDAGPLLVGGGFAVRGGFLGSALAVQTPGAPRLSIEAAGNSVTLSWAPDAPGFILQFSDTPEAVIWEDAPSGAMNPVTLPLVPGVRLYRLKHP